jgi:hypothetical protein
VGWPLRGGAAARNEGVLGRLARPVATVEAAVVDGLGYVVGLDVDAVFEVGNGARHL